MIHLCRVRNARHIDSHEGAAKPADRQRNLTGLFVHTGVMELVARGNKGALPVLVSSSGRLRLRAAVFARFDAAHIVWIGRYDGEQ
jgi:hypothetical protein